MTKRPLKPEDEATLHALRERMLLTLRFTEETQPFPSAAKLRDLVDQAAADRNLRDMRLLAREVDAMTIAAPPDEREGLEALLKARLGIDKDAERAQVRRRVRTVLERGTIASEKERRRLEDYAETLEATGGNRAEIEAIRRLLSSG